MTVEEIGWFAAGFYDDEYLPRYRRLIADYDLPGRQKIKNLSKGMRAKVSLSLALALDPELLILDEPTSGLDALVRREFLESMVDRAASGRTVFLSSHQIVEVEKVADYVAILGQSDLLLVERLDELKQQIREVTLTLAAGAIPPEVSGEIISRRQQARQWKLLVRNLPEAGNRAACGSIRRCNRSNFTRPAWKRFSSPISNAAAMATEIRAPERSSEGGRSMNATPK